jgi:hypothetical protein
VVCPVRLAHRSWARPDVRCQFERVGGSITTAGDKRTRSLAHSCVSGHGVAGGRYAAMRGGSKI